MDIDRRTVITGSLGAVASGAVLLGSAGAADARSRGLLRMGSSGSAVRSLQRRLTDLSYWLGPADGAFGPLTQQAVYALQKAAGITRDGLVGPMTWSHVDRGTKPSARFGGHLIEIDLDRQLLYIAEGGHIHTVLNTSTGSGKRYYSQGKWQVATTPRGSFRTFRQVDAWDDGPLGALYRPKYFNGGIAVHGYGDVPPYPASHGCCRVSIGAIDLIWRHAPAMPIGRRVRVY